MPAHNGTKIFDAIEMRFGNRTVAINPLGMIGENPRVRGETAHLKPGYGALILVGLSVGGVPTYTADDIRDFVLHERRNLLRAHLGALYDSDSGVPGHGGSIIPQLGYWDMIYGKKGFEESRENSVGVRLYNFPSPVPRDEFIADMEELGNRLAVHFQQDYVYVLIDNGGLVEENIEITSREV